MPTAGTQVGSGVGNDDADAAIKAARKALPVALSYDYRTLDKSVDGGDQADDDRGSPRSSAQTFDATTRSMATEKQAITSALVRGAGIVGSARDGRATVLDLPGSGADLEQGQVLERRRSR